MYKVIKLKTLSEWSAVQFSVFKCEMSEAKEIMDTIESIYTTAKFLNYNVLVTTFKPEILLPRIILKFVNENKTIIADLYVDSEYLIQDILLNNGEDEDFYSYTQARRDNMIDNTTVEDFNRSTESIPNKFKKLLGLL